ncbi:MAG: hypothetical protein WKF59_20555 [Chitinophagaceae bacterium]
MIKAQGCSGSTWDENDSGVGRLNWGIGEGVRLQIVISSRSKSKPFAVGSTTLRA